MILGKRKANVGRRKSDNFETAQSNDSSKTTASHTHEISISTTKPSNSSSLIEPDGKHIAIARPGLVVVAGYLYGAGVYKMFEEAGIVTQSASVSWGREVLQAIDAGILDLAIYNNLETIEYLQENPESTLKIIGSIGASMAGKNFAITVSANSDLVGTPLDELPNKLSGRQLYVGINTDRYRNILAALKMTEEEFIATGVNIIDFPDPPLSIIKNNPMALLVCGQNTRVAAQIDESFVEILNYDTIAAEDKQRFYRASENCLIASARLFKMLKVTPNQLIKHFARNLIELHYDNEALDELISYLKISGFTFSEQQEFDCDKLARQIMFETYHVGSRQW